MGQRREQVEELPVGNIVAIEGLKMIKSGETMIDGEFIDQMIPFESVKYVSNPVVTVSIEPEYLRDLDKMKELVENLLIEDPNLRFEIKEENGEFLLSGTGPLHLEVSANEIERRGIKVSISSPRAVFKESCRGKSELIIVKSQNSESVLEIKVERLDTTTSQFFQLTDHNNIKPLSHLKEVLKEKTTLSSKEIEHFWKCDKDQNILIYQGQSHLTDFQKEMILKIIENIHLNGPLCGEILTEIKITIEKINIRNLDEENIFTELSSMFYEGVKKGFNESEIILLEPIYHTFIQLPPNHLKNALSLLSKYSAKINGVDQEDEYQTVIEVLIPVRNSLKFAEDIRSTTSGRAFWQNEFHAYLEVPAQESTTIINDLRFLKGLSW